MHRSHAPQVLLLIMFAAAFSGLSGLTTRGIQTWDEGVYYSEGRFVANTARLAATLAWGRLFPRPDSPDLASLKQTVNGLAPSMGRPANTLLNSLGIAVLGDRPWVPALLAALSGLGCIYLSYLIMRRQKGEGAGLLAAALLTLSPYFLPYRRLGMCEAGGALVAMLTLWLLLQTADDTRGSAQRRHSWWLGVLCGLAFGVNTRTLMLLPAVVGWRAWLARVGERNGEGPAAWQDRWWLHGARVALGFALMIALYQLPYIVAQPVASQFGLQLESYLSQLQRFAAAQKELGRVGLAEAFAGPAYFFLRNEGPSVLLFVAGLAGLIWQRGRTRLPVLASVLVLPLLQTAVLIPYARYQSWLLPIFAMLAAAGLHSLWEAGRKASRGTGVAVLVVAFLIVGAHSVWRGGPVLGARSQHPAALEWCWSQGAQCLVDSNMSAAFSLAPLYRLEQLWQLPQTPQEAARAIRQLGHKGGVFVVVETQQFMKSALLMSTQEYERSAAGLLGRDGRPLWQADDHLRGLFPFLCFEHNRSLRETLEVMRKHGSGASRVCVYEGTAALEVLEKGKGVGSQARAGKERTPGAQMPTDGSESRLGAILGWEKGGL